MRIVSFAFVASFVIVGCSKEPPAAAPAQVASSAPTASAVPAASAAPVASSASPGELAVGKPAPSFSAKAHDGVEVSTAAAKGKPMVVYFYPKDETPGCTKEACSFRDAWKQLAKANVVLVGVSADDDESHKAFAKHHELPFHLVSDKDGSIAKLFGVPAFGRQSFVIGADGNVKKIYRTVDVTKHAAEILADVQ